MSGLRAHLTLMLQPHWSDRSCDQSAAPQQMTGLSVIGAKGGGEQLVGKGEKRGYMEGERSRAGYSNEGRRERSEKTCITEGEGHRFGEKKFLEQERSNTR